MAATRELLSLRARAASALLREQRFDADALLSRDGADNQTLRALVCGLQNELWRMRERCQMLEQVGAGAPEPAPGESYSAQ